MMENDEIILTNDEKKKLNSFIQLLENNKDEIKNKIQKELLNIMFKIINIYPRKFNELISKITNYFFLFLKTRDKNVITLAGQQAIKNGLSIHIVLSFTRIFNNLLLDYIPVDKYDSFRFIFSIVNDYMETYFTAFIEDLIIQKHQDQERLYKTQTKTIKKKEKQLAEKEKQIQQAKFNALQAEHKRRLDFVLRFAHEVKSPLTVIQDLISVVSNLFYLIKNKLTKIKIFNEIPLLNKIENLLNRLKNQITSLKSMILNILDSEKIQLKKELYEKHEIIDLSTFVRSKINLYNSIAMINNITFSSVIDTNLYTKIHSEALDRVLTNLIENAIKYKKKDRNLISINAKSTEKEIYLIIQDTGIGIPGNKINLIFEPYYRCSEKKIKNGVGVGLTIVKEILTEVGAKIDIKSKEGEGTVVTITFKREKVKNEEKIKKINEKELSKPLIPENIRLKQPVFDKNKRTILVVDDEKSILETVQYHLNKDFNVYFSTNGSKALKLLNRIPVPDVIISDIIMPVMDGYKFFKEIQKIKKFKDIPFIFLTGKTGEDEKLKALKEGAFDFLEKPIKMSLLIQTLKTHIKNIENIEKKGRKKAVDEIKSYDEKFKEKFFIKYKITEKEKIIIEGILNGEYNEVVRHRLNYSEGYLRQKTYMLYKKINSFGGFDIKNKEDFRKVFRTHSL